MKKIDKKIKKGLLLATGEIFLKSEGVQKALKRKLINNLSYFLKRENVDFKIHLFHQRTFIQVSNLRKTTNILKRTFGIAWFAEAFFIENTTLKEISCFVKTNYKDWIKPKETFALALRKSANIKESREEIIKIIAKNIERKVNLNKPKRKIFLEVKGEKTWFLYFRKQRGPNGLPIGSQEKVLSLVSGGIDSPVSSHLIAKRGAENVWLHFHSFPLVSNSSIEKIKELAKIFLNYQPRLKILFIPFADIQTKIKINTPAKYRVLLYRRIMLKIAQKLAKKENCQALVTGESLGQVSSQTLPNIQITQEVLKIPVLRPLIGMNKEEIILLAKKIGTFEVSIKPQEDCCTLFVPKHQTAAGKIEVVKKIEKTLNLNKLISAALKSAEVQIFS
ncbi:MAG: tRNA 4-thiouridine(8) synthase ThiI [Candidatus Pacebacteria bacterium]|nr:tRNA 4-thiouridine(8) synthase ThiI [Candidatus Paceibacterota bacterium]